MAAVTLRSEFYDDYGTPYSILIYDKNLTGGFGAQFAWTVKGSIVLTDEGDDNNPFKRIIPKKLSWTILMHATDYLYAQRAAILEFYNSLTQSPEGRFYVVLMQGTQVIFRGKVLADVGDLSLTFHKELNLSATDGLLQLKDIDYRPKDYNDEVPEELIKLISFKDHFTDLLSRNDVVDFFYKDPLFVGTTMALFTTSTNWVPTTSYSIPGDVFKYVCKKNTYFEKEESKKYRKYTNCFDALQDLITGFNGRIYFANGAYHIEALGYQDNLTLVRYAYDITGTATTDPGNKVTHDISDNPDIYVLTTPSLKHIPPFKAVILKQNQRYNNILSGINMYWDRTLPDNRGPLNMGYIIGAGNQLVFDLRLKMIITNTITANTTIYIEWEIKIQIGDYYLVNNPITDNVLEVLSGNFVYGVKQFLWSSTPGTFKILKKSGFSVYNAANFDIYSITGLSDEIPEDGDFIITIVNWRVLNASFADVPSMTALMTTLTISKNTRIFVVTNGLQGLTEVPDNTVIYEIGDVKNSIVYEEKLTYHDFNPVNQGFYSLHLAIPGAVFTGYQMTTEWTDADMGETLPIIDLLLKQMLGMRKIPNRVARITTERSDQTIMSIGDRYAIGSNLYIPLRVQHNIDSGNYQLSLWSPIKDYDGVNIVRFSNDILQTSFVPTIDDPARYINTSITYYEKFTGVTDPYITTSEALNFYFGGSPTADEIDSRWTVLVNGVVQMYKDATGLTFPLTGGELNMGEYTCDPDNDHFWFAFNDNVTIIIKYLKP